MLCQPKDCFFFLKSPLPALGELLPFPGDPGVGAGEGMRMTGLQPPCQAGPPPQQSLRAGPGRASWCPARSRAGGGGRKEEPVLPPPKLTTDQRVPAFLSLLPRTPPSLCSWRVLGFSWKISGKRRELCSRLCHRGAGDVKIILILVTLGPFQRRETAHQYNEPAPGREGKAGWSAQGTPWSFPLRTPGLKGQSHGKSPTSAFVGLPNLFDVL